MIQTRSTITITDPRSHWSAFIQHVAGSAASAACCSFGCDAGRRPAVFLPNRPRPGGFAPGRPATSAPRPRCAPPASRASPRRRRAGPSSAPLFQGESIGQLESSLTKNPPDRLLRRLPGAMLIPKGEHGEAPKAPSWSGPLEAWIIRKRFCLNRQRPVVGAKVVRGTRPPRARDARPGPYSATPFGGLFDCPCCHAESVMDPAGAAWSPLARRLREFASTLTVGPPCEASRIQAWPAKQNERLLVFDGHVPPRRGARPLLGMA